MDGAVPSNPHYENVEDTDEINPDGPYDGAVASNPQYENVEDLDENNPGGPDGHHDYENVEALEKVKLDEVGDKETDTDDSGYVKFIRRPVPAQPETVAVVHAPYDQKELALAKKIVEFFAFHLGKKSIVEAVDISDYASEEVNVEKIGNADRIILLASKKLTVLCNNGGQSCREAPDDNVIIDLIDRVLKVSRQPGHDRVFATYFNHSTREEFPSKLITKFGRVYGLDFTKLETVETFFGRLLHKKGTVSFPAIKNSEDGGLGSKLRKAINDIVRHRKTVSLTRRLIRHGESMGFCESDFQKNCLDILRQERLITREEYQLVLQECTLADKVDTLQRLVNKKAMPILPEYQKLIDVWNDNKPNDEPKKYLLRNRITFIEGIVCIGPLLDKLRQAKVISNNVASGVQNERTEEDKVRRLLDELPNTRKAVSEFREILRKDYPWLAGMIESDGSGEDDSDDSITSI
ncbi:uncharacterized protein [Ptychodera flava]|uniref:uncharacterized protein n=1 Tax=Ptychodera flava TaxID=63121 RepID=UPI00396AAF62